jgi:hypothetical protein
MDAACGRACEMPLFLGVYEYSDWMCFWAVWQLTSVGLCANKMQYIRKDSILLMLHSE